MPVEVLCFNCGKTIVRPPSAARSETTFCTIQCRAQFQARDRMNQTAEQFWSRVAVGEPHECWEWTGHRSSKGYGRMGWKGKLALTHRIAMSLTDNDWTNKLPVCHGCDNPPCCNPSHLWRGTHRQNYDDMVRKGRERRARGAEMPHSKITDQIVLTIRASTRTQKELAERYGISTSAISHIKAHRTWRHIP